MFHCIQNSDTLVVGFLGVALPGVRKDVTWLISTHYITSGQMLSGSSGVYISGAVGVPMSRQTTYHDHIPFSTYPGLS